MKIKSINKRQTQEKVYDFINVKDNHNFIVKTNSKKEIVLHNSFLEVTDDSKKSFDGGYDACEEMANAILNRMTSRFLKNNYLPGLLAFITSPNMPDDYVHRLIEIAKNDPDSGIFWRRRPTWIAKGKKFFPDDDFFYIDTDLEEIITDKQVLDFLDCIDPKQMNSKKFPIDIDYNLLADISRGLKK
jgi:hypothetical protein